MGQIPYFSGEFERKLQPRRLFTMLWFSMEEIELDSFLFARAKAQDPQKTRHRLSRRCVRDAIHIIGWYNVLAHFSASIGVSVNGRAKLKRSVLSDFRGAYYRQSNCAVSKLVPKRWFYFESYYTTIYSSLCFYVKSTMEKIFYMLNDFMCLNGVGLSSPFTMTVSSLQR